jgi:hypothetical protein
VSVAELENSVVTLPQAVQILTEHEKFLSVVK